MKLENEKFCFECGQPINVKAEICPKCGVRQPAISFPNKTKENEWLTVLLLCYFTGVFGVHRFYTGHTAIGVIQLLTLGGCGIWVLIDFILIVSGNYKDIHGNLIKSN